MRLIPSWLNTYVAFTGLFCSYAVAQEDDSLEGLYLRAGEKIQAGDYEGALPLYEEALKFLNVNAIGEDYGSGIGGVYFEYGTCLLFLRRWEDARDVFKICVKDYPNKESKSKLDSGNKRWNLALFQWGYCEQQMGNPEKALKLYKQYRDSKPNNKEWEAVRNVYHLRLGGTLIAAGKMDEGIEEEKKLIINSDKWKIQPELLKQALKIIEDANKRKAEQADDGVRDK